MLHHVARHRYIHPTGMRSGGNVVPPGCSSQALRLGSVSPGDPRAQTDTMYTRQSMVVRLSSGSMPTDLYNPSHLQTSSTGQMTASETAEFFLWRCILAPPHRPPAVHGLLLRSILRPLLLCTCMSLGHWKSSLRRFHGRGGPEATATLWHCCGQ